MDVDQPDASANLSSEESGLLICSTKKQKATSQDFCPQWTLHFYKDSLVQPIHTWEDHSLQNLRIFYANIESDQDEESDQDDNSNDTSPLILLSKEDKQHIRAPWRSTLIIKAFGKSLGFKYIDYKIQAIWKPQGKLQCIDLSLDYFLIRFRLKEDYWKVLNKGPWFIGQQFLTMRQWYPSFKPSKAKLTSTAIWARLLKLPIKFYDNSILQRIVNQLGNLLKIDARTIDNVKGRFARLCIQVDLDSPLISKIWIGSLTQPVQYDGISFICFECGCIGHQSASYLAIICPSSTLTPANNTDTTKGTTKTFWQVDVGQELRIKEHKSQP